VIKLLPVSKIRVHYAGLFNYKFIVGGVRSAVSALLFRQSLEKHEKNEFYFKMVSYRLMTCRSEALQPLLFNFASEYTNALCYKLEDRGFDSRLGQ
jgi:hypothetical protein